MWLFLMMDAIGTSELSPAAPTGVVMVGETVGLYKILQIEFAYSIWLTKEPPFSFILFSIKKQPLLITLEQVLI